MNLDSSPRSSNVGRRSSSRTGRLPSSRRGQPTTPQIRSGSPIWLQQRSPEQCGWLHHAEGHARRASTGDPCRAGSEVGGGPKTAPGSSSEGRVKNEEPRSQSRMKRITSGLRPPGHNPNNQLQMSPVQAVGRSQTKSANPSRTWLSGYGRGRSPHLPLSWA
jgi:hypothetical protein